MAEETKVAIVTGAARGLGAQYARTLADAGMAVVCADIRDAGPVAAAIDDGGGRAIATALDVSDMASCEAAAAAATDAFGRIDVLVNNAALYGDATGGRFTDISEAAWDEMMAINVKGIWQAAKAVVPAMRAGGGGSIVNIASLAAVYGMPYALHYTTSKAAVIGLTRGLARELGRYWIRVNAVAPGAVLTDGTRGFLGDDHDRVVAAIRDGQTLKRNMATEDIAGTVRYLASDASRFVTGQTIMVDGGSVFL